MTGPSHREMEGGEDKKAKSVSGGGKGRRPLFPPPPTCPTGAAVLTPARRCSRQPAPWKLQYSPCKNQYAAQTIPHRRSPWLWQSLQVVGARITLLSRIKGTCFWHTKTFSFPKGQSIKKLAHFPHSLLYSWNYAIIGFEWASWDFGSPSAHTVADHVILQFKFKKRGEKKKRSRRSQNHMYRCTNPLYFSSSDPEQMPELLLLISRLLK